MKALGRAAAHRLVSSTARPSASGGADGKLRVRQVERPGPPSGAHPPGCGPGLQWPMTVSRAPRPMVLPVLSVALNSRFTKRTHFSSQPAQTETTCTHPDEAARAVHARWNRLPDVVQMGRRARADGWLVGASGWPADLTVAFERDGFGGAGTQVAVGMGERNRELWLLSLVFLVFLSFEPYYKSLLFPINAKLRRFRLIFSLTVYPA